MAEEHDKSRRRTAQREHQHHHHHTTHPPRIVVDHESERNEKDDTRHRDDHHFKRPPSRSSRESGGSSSKRESNDSKKLSTDGKPTRKMRSASVAEETGRHSNEHRLTLSIEGVRLDEEDDDLGEKNGARHKMAHRKAGTYREPRQKAREVIPMRASDWHDDAYKKKRQTIAIGLMGTLAEKEEQVTRSMTRKSQDELLPSRPKSARTNKEEEPRVEQLNGQHSTRHRFLDASAQREVDRERSRTQAVDQVKTLDDSNDVKRRSATEKPASVSTRSKLESDSAYVQTARDEGKKNKKVILVAGLAKKEHNMGEAVRVSVELDNLSSKPLKCFRIELVKQGSTYEFFKKGFVEHRKLKKRGEEVYHSQKYEPQVGDATSGSKGPWSFRGDIDFVLPDDLAPSYAEKTANYKVVYFLKVAAELKHKKKPREVKLKIVILERPQ